MSSTEFDLSILSDLTGAYDASVVEDPIYAFWEDNGWFRPADADPSSSHSRAGGERAVHGDHAAAERDRGAASGSRGDADD